jgi:hypothetical protein
VVDSLRDLAKYTPTPAEGAVVAYPVKKAKARRGLGEREMEFTIKAQVLKAKPAEEPKAEEPKAEEPKAEEAKKEEVKEEVKKDEL